MNIRNVNYKFARLKLFHSFTEEVVDMRQPNDTFFDVCIFTQRACYQDILQLQELVQIFDNLLSPSNEEGWVELQEVCL